MAKNPHAIVETEQLRREVLCDNAVAELKERVVGLDLPPEHVAAMEEVGSVTMQHLLRKNPKGALVHSLPDMVSKAIMYLNMVNDYGDVKSYTALGRMAAAIEVNTASYRVIFNEGASCISARKDFALAAALEAKPSGLSSLMDYLEGPFSSLFVEGIRRHKKDADTVIEEQKDILWKTRAGGLEIFCRVPQIPALG